MVIRDFDINLVVTQLLHRNNLSFASYSYFCDPNHLRVIKKMVYGISRDIKP